MTHTSAAIRSIWPPPRRRSRSVLELLQQLDELRTRVRPIGGHHHASHPAGGTLDAEDDHLVARVGLALEPERPPDEQLRRRVADIARAATDRAVGEREVAAVAVG